MVDNDVLVNSAQLVQTTDAWRDMEDHDLNLCTLKHNKNTAYFSYMLQSINEIVLLWFINNKYNSFLSILREL